ncbi:capsid cement protein [Arthrobacter sp. TmT3-37]
MEHIRKFNPGAGVTFSAETDVVGGRLGAISGDRQISHAAAGSRSWFGVIAFDAKAGEDVTVYPGGVQSLEVVGTVAAGDLVIPAADGKVAPIGAADASLAVGPALVGATNARADIAFSR